METTTVGCVLLRKLSTILYKNSENNYIIFCLLANGINNEVTENNTLF